MSSRLSRIERRIYVRDVRFRPKVGQIGTNPGLFQISVSQNIYIYIFFHVLRFFA